MNEIASLYGSAMAMMLKHERQVLAEPERMPGLRSSFLCNLSLMKLCNRTWVVLTKSSSKMYSIEAQLLKVQMLTNSICANSIDQYR